MAATTGRCFSVGASVPAPTDVAGGRNNFEQPFSAFGQPGPRFDQHLESIDAKKKQGNKNHRNFANGIANLDSKAAQQERQEVLGYRTWKIFSKYFWAVSASICLPRTLSPPHPLAINVDEDAVKAQGKKYSNAHPHPQH